jgi:hypothetical protein
VDRFAGRERVTDPQKIKHCVKRALVSVIRARNKELGIWQDAHVEQFKIDNIKHLQGTWESGWTVSKEENGWNFDLSDVDFRFSVSLPLSSLGAWTNTFNQVVKKLAIISGIRLSDPAIMRSKSGYKLMDEAEVLPKPKKLIVRNPDPKQADELVIAGQTRARKTTKPKLDLSLLDLPNVKVSERRISKEDREKQIGRWKVVEEELQFRRLSVEPFKPRYNGQVD